MQSTEKLRSAFALIWVTSFLCTFASDNKQVAGALEILQKSAERTETIRTLLLPFIYPDITSLTLAYADERDQKIIGGENIAAYMRMACNPTGTQLALAGNKQVIDLFTVKTGNKEKTLPRKSKEEITSLTYAHNDSILAAGYSDGIIKLWDSSTGQEIDSLSFESKRSVVSLDSLNFSKNDKKLVCLKDSQIARFMITYDREKREKHAHAGRNACAVTWHPDNTHLIVLGNDAIYLYNPVNRKHIESSAYNGFTRCSYGPTSVYNSDGQTCMYINQKLLWRYNRLTKTLEQLPKEFMGDSSKSVALAQDDTYLVVGCEGGVIRTRNIQTGDISEWHPSDSRFSEFRSVIVSPDACTIFAQDDLCSKVYMLRLPA
jgi:WD40 repeat protein